MKSHKPAALAANILKYAVLIVGAFFTLLPFLWMISSSFKTPAEIIKIPPVLVPAVPQWQNYLAAWTAAPFGRYLINTIIITFFTTIGVLITSVLSAFAFSRLKFPGKDFVFSLFMATLMIPGEMLIITNFLTITKLHWIDTYQAIILPAVANGMTIFMFRQSFRDINDSLIEAARIDGAGEFRTFWQIIMPVSIPSIISGSLVMFTSQWNAFMWPLLVARSDKLTMLQVALTDFQLENGTMWAELFAGITISMLIPCMILIPFQKYYIRGISSSGMKD